jgi:hypothetical protein
MRVIRESALLNGNGGRFMVGRACRQVRRSGWWLLASYSMFIENEEVLV